MPDRPHAAADRPPVHPTEGASRCIAVRIKVPDARRLDAALASRGLRPSDYLRGLILRDLDALDNGTPLAME